MSAGYRLGRLAGTGGMAEVYLGVVTGEEGFEKPVAIKRILPHLASDPRVARMFLAEVKAATHLQHQNIVQVLDVGRSSDGLFIVMELIDGWDLGEVLSTLRRRNERLSPPLAAFIAAQALTGLCYAYKRTHEGKPLVVAHRDVSPSNILLSSAGEVKVGDFGIAKLEQLSGGTDPGTFKGKVAYSAPEAFTKQAVDALSDQFSLGLVLYEMLAGQHAFGARENALGYLSAIQSEEPAPLGDLPAALASAVMRMLKKDRSQRFETAEAALRALTSYLATAGTPATSVELSAFLASSGMGPSISQRDGNDTTSSGTFSLHGTSTAMNSEFRSVLEEDWQPQGPVLDVSGRLDMAPSRSPLDPLAKTHISGELPNAEPSALDLEPTAPPPASAFEPPPETAEEQLELARPLPHVEAAARGEQVLEEPLPKKKWLPKVIVGLTAAALFAAAGATVLWPRIQTLISGPAKAVLFINSEPSGATVLIDGKQIGQTPLAMENLYGPAEIPYLIVKDGFRPHQGKFLGGQSQEISVPLKRQ